MASGVYGNIEYSILFFGIDIEKLFNTFLAKVLDWVFNTFSKKILDWYSILFFGIGQRSGQQQLNYIILNKLNLSSRNSHSNVFGRKTIRKYTECVGN